MRGTHPRLACQRRLPQRIATRAAIVTRVTRQLASGDSAPDFSLPDADGNSVSLADYAGSRVIVYFYPAAMTPGCTTQAVDFSGAMSEFASDGFHVVGISPDSVTKLATFRQTQAVAFPLLSDVDRATLLAYGAYGEKMLYGKLVEGVVRSTFVIEVDKKGRGTIHLAQYNVKATGHVERLKRELALTK